MHPLSTLVSQLIIYYTGTTTTTTSTTNDDDDDGGDGDGDGDGDGHKKPLTPKSMPPTMKLKKHTSNPRLCARIACYIPYYYSLHW